MAAPSSTVWGSAAVGSEKPSGRQGKIGIYTNISNTATQTTVNIEVWYWTIYSNTDKSNQVFFDVGTNVTSASTSVAEDVVINHPVNSGAGWSTSNQTKLYSNTYTYTRDKTAKTYKIYARFAGIDMLDSQMRVDTSFTVPALATYTVAYNVNGGSGSFATQTKYHGIDLQLHSATPTRTGYSFTGWALTKADADAGKWYYSVGSKCGKNENLTLYATWKANTYTVSYNANGGSGAPANQTKTYGVNLTLSNTVPTRTNYTFLGWSTSSSATSATYNPGGSFTTNANTTLYAVWLLSYVKPRITNVSISRSNSSGTVSDSGTYALVAFDWACDRTVSSIVVKWTDAAGASSSAAVSVSGTSGRVSTLVGNGSLSADKMYRINITVTDAGGSSYATGTLYGTKFVIDFLNGGNGVAFGKAAERSGYVEFGFDAFFNGSVRGNVLGLGTFPQILSNEDFNAYLTPGVYGVGQNTIAGTLLNNPAGARAGRLIVTTATGNGYGVGEWTYLQQWYIPMSFTASDSNAFYVRTITREPNKAPNYYQWLKFTGVSA